MKTLVVKIGSSSLINDEGKINRAKIIELVNEINLLKNKGVSPIIVTSGAVAVGSSKLGIKPKTVKMKQACAAIGQASLMHDYDLICDMYGLKCAQILLNHDDFDDRKRMKNLENTITSLLENNVIPIINENDALAVEEIKLGDNDTLSALIASMVNANLLVLISDIDGLYDKNPKIYSNAKLLKVVEKIDDEIINMAGGATTQVGTGGMSTKIKAAKIATSSGVDMIIMNNNNLKNLNKVFEEEMGTLFKASENKLNSKLKWVSFNSHPKGIIYIDQGAKNAILSRTSLLAKGIIDVKSNFKANDVISVVCDDLEIARGISNFSSEEIKMVKGHNSSEIKEILGYDAKNVVIHANYMVLMEE